MTLHEFLIRLLVIVKPAIPAAIIVLAVTLIASLIIAKRAKGLWVNKPQFRRLGILYGLSKIGCMRLACAWIKLVLLIIFLAMFKKLDAVHYILFFVPGILYAVLGDPRQILSRIFWVALEAAGLLSTNLVCSYYYDMRGGSELIVMYAVMAVFMFLFGCYLFLTEAEDISEGRGAVKYEA